MSSRQMTKSELMDAIADASRRYSTSTVLFHTILALRLGLNPTDHKCIDLVVQRGPLTAGELSDLTGLTTGSITAVIDRLEQAQFVRRVRDPHDRRKVLVEPLTTRFPEVQEVFTGLLEAHAELLSRYTRDELTLILDYISRITDIMDQQAATLRASRGNIKPE